MGKDQIKGRVGRVEREVDKTAGNVVSNLMESSNLVGSVVQNHRREYLGEIKEVMLYTYGGQVSCAVLSFGGGFLGMGKKLFAVPWEALAFNSRSGSVVVTVEKDRLESTPGFEKNSWLSTMDDSLW